MQKRVTAAWAAREERKGRVLLIGGAEDIGHGPGALQEFVSLCGERAARIALVATAAEPPGHGAHYQRIFRELGAGEIQVLRLESRAAADAPSTLSLLADATGIFISGGDRSRLRMIVGSETNTLLGRRLQDDNVVIAGTSAGATALGRTMILGGEGHDVAASGVRTSPGLGLLPDVVIDTHFSERGRLPRLLSAIALDPAHLGVGIDEDTAILIGEDSFVVLGTGAVTVIDADNATVGYAATDDEPIILFDVRLNVLTAGCGFDILTRTPSMSPTTNSDG